MKLQVRTHVSLAIRCFLLYKVNDSAGVFSIWAHDHIPRLLGQDCLVRLACDGLPDEKLHKSLYCAEVEVSILTNELPFTPVAQLVPAPTFLDSKLSTGAGDT
jgi:hypothetical protein